MESSLDNDRRTSFRIPYLTKADYTWGVQFVEGSVENIGPNGMFLLTTETFEVGKIINIRFRFRHGRYKMNLKGEIARTAVEGVGVKFLWI